MNEAITHFLVIVLAAVSIANAQAQDSGVVIKEEATASQPTIFYGQGLTAPNQKDVFVVEQPASAPNPLGAPIVDEVNKSMDTTPAILSADKIEPSLKVAPNNLLGVPKEDEKGFYNRIYEGTTDMGQARVYDVQSYPQSDIPLIDGVGNPAVVQKAVVPN